MRVLSNIVMLISQTFAIMVLVANLFAWPVAYFAMRSWLEGFAYRTDISWWIFVLSGCGCIGDCVAYGELPTPSARLCPIRWKPCGMNRLG